MTTNLVHIHPKGVVCTSMWANFNKLPSISGDGIARQH